MTLEKKFKRIPDSVLYFTLAATLGSAYMLPYPLKNEWRDFFDYNGGRLIIEKPAYELPRFEIRTKEELEDPIMMPPETRYQKNA